MTTTHPAPSAANSPALLFGLSARLNIGSAVCITEGLAASIMVMLPKNHWYYFGGALLGLLIWLAFFRFRETKLGADIADLCFYDFMARSVVPLGMYLADIAPDLLWYLWASFAILKLYRVYLWPTSATQQQGWGRFGPMTRYQAKHFGRPAAVTPQGKLATEIFAALIVAGVASITIKALPDFGRVIVMWVVPLGFEFIYGPILLRKMALLNTQANTNAPSTPADDAEVEDMRRTIAAYRKQQPQANAQPDEALALIIEAYYKTVEMKRVDMMEFAQAMAKAYPESDDTTH